MRRLSALLIAFLFAAVLALPSRAQNYWPTPGGSNADGFLMMCMNGSNQPVPCSVSFPLQVSASVSASVSGFRPTNTGTPISVTTGGVTGSLPTNAGEVMAYNVGTTNTAYCALGASATTAATPILPGQGVGFGISGDTQMTCITSASTTTVNLVGGAGLPTGWGGSGSGGSGGAVTIASGGVASGAYASGAYASGAISDGADVTLGTKADSVCGTATGTCTLQALIKFLNTAVSSAIPTGGNTIGYTSNDPCTNGIKVSSPISETSPTARAIIAASGSAKIYVCSLALIAGSAGTVSLIEGTSICTGSPKAVAGSLTAANGMSLAANGGLTLGGGHGTVASTATGGDAVCLYGFTGTIAGVITAVFQ